MATQAEVDAASARVDAACGARSPWVGKLGFAIADAPSSDERILLEHENGRIGVGVRVDGGTNFWMDAVGHAGSTLSAASFVSWGPIPVTEKAIAHYARWTDELRVAEPTVSRAAIAQLAIDAFRQQHPNDKNHQLLELASRLL